jgi:hypothetical protein
MHSATWARTFTSVLGYDLTDPRECVPEYKADFGKDRSSKPIDWAFLHSGNFAFFVEAKGKKLGGYDEQLADYFAKDPNVKLGILTNGAQWRFFTDVEWAKQRMLHPVLNAPSAAAAPAEDGSKIETTKEELDAFEVVTRLLGKDFPVAYEDSVAYFKIHLPERRTWVMTRLQMNRKVPLVWVPLPADEVIPLAGGRDVSTVPGWSQVALDKPADIASLGDLFRAAYEKVRRAKAGSGDGNDG